MAISTTKHVDNHRFGRLLAHWVLETGAFWIILIIIITWFFKTASLIQQRDAGSQARRYDSKQLVSSIKSRRAANVSFAKHVVLLVLEIVEGYWLLSYWWLCTYGNWTLRIQKDEWLLRLVRAISLFIMGLALIALLSAGLMLVVITLSCLYELWRWEPEDSEDTSLLLQIDQQVDQEKEDTAGDREEQEQESKQENEQGLEEEKEAITTWVRA